MATRSQAWTILGEPDRSPAALLERVEFLRLDASRKLRTALRAELGQFFTPLATARLMASMCERTQPTLRLLDAGAGVGSLFAAWVAQVCQWKRRPRAITLTAYEVDPTLVEYLNCAIESCQAACRAVGITFSADVRQEDFIKAGVAMLRQDLFSPPLERFDCAILNPPYRKIRSRSETRLLLRSIGIETSNLYTAFLAIVVRLLAPGGEVAAITPRSFCNGPYFRAFRQAFLGAMTLRRVHVYDSRSEAFQDDDVLQENVILHAAKEVRRPATVTISTSPGPEDEHVTLRTVDHDELVRPTDPEAFIHIVPDELSDEVAQLMGRFRTVLPELGLKVSTGRVVDFRASEHLRASPGRGTVPLIYPGHTADRFVSWPRHNFKKPNAIADVAATQNLLVPRGWYVLVKRFSAKEEPRRVTAALYDPTRVPGDRVGFENHLNYYHAGGRGLPVKLAKGLAAFLNSTLVDLHFRQFSGHTQVNATDLRNLKYPTRAELEALGARMGRSFPEQDELDRLVKEELLPMPTESANDPVGAKKRVDEALAVLKDLGLPREQQNERSALVLLALLNLTPDKSWGAAANPLCGITPMMGFIAAHYGKKYAPNTRETVRRQTVHQFLQAGLIVANPDHPARPVNSPKAVYRIEAGALDLLRQYGTAVWDKSLRTYLTSIETLKKRYAKEREMKRFPVTVGPGKSITLSPGGQNVLIRTIIEEFCPRFTPGGQLVYVGDTDEKWAYFDEELLGSLGVRLDAHGKMPDIVVYHKRKGWLVLIEAVTSHGPVNPKRRHELKELFKDSKAGLVFVTTFLDRRAMVKYLDDISWETEVWVAEAPSHMIHFNGERFLGPY